MKVFTLQENTKSVGLLFSFSLTVFMIFQLLLYREHAFEMSVLYAKKAVGVVALHDQKKMGAICNSLHRLKCAERFFSEILNDYPNDLDALSNLAMALVGQGQYEKAEPYFKAYFAGDGASQEIMYWYGKSCEAQGEFDSALLWFYNVLYYNASNELASAELFKILHLQNRNYEAQSLLAALLAQTGSDEQKAIWQKQFDLYSGRVGFERSVASMGELAKRRIALPALDGRNFYIPIHSNGQVAGFIHSVETEMDTRFSEKDLSRFRLNAKKIGGTRVLIKSLEVGPFELTNFEAAICDNCDSRLGGRLLSRISAHIDGRGKVPYLILHEGEAK